MAPAPALRLASCPYGSPLTTQPLARCWATFADAGVQDDISWSAAFIARKQARLRDAETEATTQYKWEDIAGPITAGAGEHTLRDVLREFQQIVARLLSGDCDVPTTRAACAFVFHALALPEGCRERDDVTRSQQLAATTKLKQRGFHELPQATLGQLIRLVDQLDARLGALGKRPARPSAADASPQIDTLSVEWGHDIPFQSVLAAA